MKDPYKIEVGPFLHRVVGRMFPGNESDPRYFQFMPAGFLEGFELWLPENINLTNSRSVVEMRVDVRVDGRPVEFERVVARYRSAEVLGGR